MVFDGLYAVSIAALGESEVAEVLPYGRHADASACKSFASVGRGLSTTTLKTQQPLTDGHRRLHMMFGCVNVASFAALGEFEVAEVLPYGRNTEASACKSFASVGLGRSATTLKTTQSFSNCHRGLNTVFSGLYAVSFAALGNFEVAEVLPYGRHTEASACYSF